MNKDYYKILNINSESSQDEIKKAFRSLSKKHHPDKGGDENTFKEMSEAYDTLSDPKKRQKYDHQRQNPFAGGGGPNMEDIFNQFFGGNQRRKQNIRRGANLNIPLVVKLEDVYFEVSKKLKYKRKLLCRTCHGTGGESIVCGSCRGRGKIEQMVGNAFFRQVVSQPCHVCNGKGKLIQKACNTCNSEGLILEDTILDFKIPGDLQTGQGYTFRSMGNEIPNGQNGDLNIEVVIQSHENFKIINRDLVYEPKIPILQLILGTKIEVPFFNSKLTVNIPPTSKPGQTFNVRGKGLKINNGSFGDLYVRPKVVAPNKLNQKEKELLGQLAVSENFRE